MCLLIAMISRSNSIFCGILCALDFVLLQVDIAGPGFINIHITKSFLLDTIKNLIVYGPLVQEREKKKVHCLISIIN